MKALQHSNYCTKPSCTGFEHGRRHANLFRPTGSCQHGTAVGRQVVAGAVSPGIDGFGDASYGRFRRDPDASGPLKDLDAEWQAFVAGNARCRQPEPLFWSADTHNRPDSSTSSSGSTSSSSDSSCSNGSTGSSGASTSPGCGCDDAPSTINRSQQPDSSKRYSSSIQSFDDWDFADDEFAIPLPSNLPVNEAMQQISTSSSSSANHTSILSSSSSEQLWQPTNLHQHSTQDARLSTDLLSVRSLWHTLKEVYVLLFGVGQKDTEGIYSLRAVSQDGLPTETIIAFENINDAIRYAALLEATMEHCPHVCSIPPTELMAFCADSDYRCRLELAGSLLMPPDYNVHITDWERSLRLREGRFSVLPEEPDVAAGSSNSEAGSKAASTSNGSNGQLLLRQHSEFTMTQLDSVKAQLEALLPEDDVQE